MSPTDDDTPRPPGSRRYGDIRIESVHGSAVSIGDGNTVTNTAADAQAYAQLTTEVLRLARELRAGARHEELAPLLEQLAAVTADIDAEGRPAPGRLERLRTLMQDAGLGLGVASAALALGRSIGSLVGG
ncbi:MAG: hypothetical protein HOY79_11430 [Streptomyces sp.]|nr:hypothetical protein [Streptomyces sp.]